MKWSDIKAALEGDDEDAKASAYATIAAAFPDEGGDDDKGEKKEEPKKDSADDAPESKKEPKKDSADDEKKDEPKKDAKAAVVASQDKALATALARIDALEAKDEETERAAVMASREMTKPLAATLAKLPLTTVKEICATLPPKAKKDLAAAAKVDATRGDTQGSASGAQAPSAKEEMDHRMGVKKRQASIKHEGKASTYEVMTREDARRHLDSKKGGAK